MRLPSGLQPDSLKSVDGQTVLVTGEIRTSACLHMHASPHMLTGKHVCSCVHTVGHW